MRKSKQQDMTIQSEPEKKFYHIAIALRMLDYNSVTEENYQEMLVPYLTEKMSREVFRDRLMKLRKKGFEVLPPCNHHDKKGYCLGHKNTK